MRILVTGSSSGIGRFLALHFVSSGHEVWGLARSPQHDFERECEAKGHAFRASQGDVSKWAELVTVRTEIQAAWGCVDALICCAGIQGPIGPAMSLDPLEWSASAHINLSGAFYTIRAFHELLRSHKAPRAKVICLSGGGSATPRANFTPYAAAKAGVVRLVETLALEWAGQPIDINAIAPGAINTRMTEEVVRLGPAVVGEKEFATASSQQREGGAPLPRVASMIDLLLSRSGDGITGRLISAPWDPWENLPMHREELARSDVFTLRRIIPEDRGKHWQRPLPSPEGVSLKAAPSPTATPLRVTVLGLWHLGSVTAACCARHFDVVGVDFEDATIADLRQGRAPIAEPGLNELLNAGLAAKRLRFTSEPRVACADADLLWLTCDTPVNDADESDAAFVLEKLRRCLPHLPAGALVLISSQLPVGTIRGLEAEFPQFHFACSPENLRLGRALDAFEKAERVVVGIRSDAKKPLLEQLFAPFTPQVLFMRTESAEMVKHALNSFLAVSITFINEIARLCEHTGADAKEVSAGLKSEARIGPKAYLDPGGPFAGGTLARDVVTLTQLGASRGESLLLIPAIKQSNDLHRGWAFRRLQARLGELRGRTVAVLGLVYTPGTDTLRRSAAVELCQQLVAAGARVQAYDPAVKSLPAELSAITLAGSLADAIRGADAAVVCTEWPAFRESPWPALIPLLRQPALIVDANRFLEAQLKPIAGVEHISVGRPA